MRTIEGVVELLSRRAAAWSIFALTLAALALRCVGIDSMLPHQPEPDAVIVWQAAWLSGLPHVLPGGSSGLPAFYPILLAETLQWLPGSSVPVVLPADASLAEHLTAASEPHLRARILIAVLSVLAIPAVYRIARSFLDRSPSVLAAAFAATSLLTTSYAQQARPHAASAAISAVAVALALRHARRGGQASFAAASAVVALGIGAFQNGVFALPALGLAWWFAPRRSLTQWLWPIAFVAFAFWRFYPFLFTPGVVESRTEELDIGGQVIALERISPVGFVRIARGLFGFDPVLAILGAAGAVIAIVHARRGSIRPRAFAVAAAFPSAFLLFWGFMSHMFSRFTVPLVPFLAVAAAIAVVACTRACASTQSRRRVLVAASIVALALPTYASVRLVLWRASDDTLTLASRWIVEHGDPARDRVAHNVLLALPLPRTRDSIAQSPAWALGPWEHYLLDLPESPALPRWSLVPVYRLGAFADRTIDLAEASSLVRAENCTLAVTLAGRGRSAAFDRTNDAVHAISGPPELRIEAFGPRHSDLGGSGFEFGFNGLERVLRARAWGPAIDCHRLPPAPEPGR